MGCSSPSCGPAAKRKRTGGDVRTGRGRGSRTASSRRSRSTRRRCRRASSPRSNPELALSLRRPEPPRPAARQRRQPVLARAARPGALRRQRLHASRRSTACSASASSATGAALTGVQDLNTFFGYPRGDQPDDRRRSGPNVIDPVCHYDPDNNRFVVVITTLHVDANGDFNGKNTIDVAVCNTGDPTGTWTIYHVPAQNDGTDGTPTTAARSTASTPGPCFQDYPHIGGDAQRRLRHDERVRPVRARASTRRRSSRSRRRSSPRTRRRST